MTKLLKLKTSESAIKGSLEDHTHIDTRPGYSKHETGKAMVEKVQLKGLLEDYERMVKALRKAGYTVERPSGKRALSGLTFAEVVPAFLRKGVKDEDMEPKKKRVRI